MDVPCNGGLEWTARALDSSPLPPGQYRLEVDLDGATFVTECTVVPEAEGPSTCTDPTIPAGSESYFFTLGVEQQGFEMSAGRMYDDRTSVEGPQSVAIVVTHDDAPFFDVEYELEYERDEEYRGDPRCGYCDLQESRLYEWQ
jgi:hypothetical protein